ncbi:MAG: TMEM175 family protein [Janthinobacterium lividum]
MHKTRLEAFSDGVFAIILTIMVLEIKVPHGATFAALRPVLPVFLSYALSFVYVGVYWNNHHHLLLGVRRINGGIMWANLHLLFWLSLTPVATGWMGENEFAPATLALYGGVLLMAALAFTILQYRLIALNGRGSLLAQAVGSDWKSKLSPVLYCVGIVSSFFNTWVSGACYVLVALLWLAPDPRIERALTAVHLNEPGSE